MFQPDIILKEPDSPRFVLVAQVVMSPPPPARLEAEVRHYMHQMGCLVGLVVSREKTLVFQDTPIGLPPESIQLVGEVETGRLLGRESLPADSVGLERAVHEWLEGLAKGDRRSLSEELSLSSPQVYDALFSASSTELMSGPPRHP